MATTRSKRFGRVRASNSGVSSVTGESSTINAVKATAAAVPSASVRRLLLPSSTFSVAIAMPLPTIGPINGEISIAPMITAGELSNRPMVAMPPATTIMKQKLNVKLASCSTCSRIPR